MPLYSPRRLHIRQLQRSPWERFHRGNLLLRCRLQARRSAQRRFGAQREERGGGISWRPPAYSLLLLLLLLVVVVIVVVVVAPLTTLLLLLLLLMLVVIGDGGRLPKTQLTTWRSPDLCSRISSLSLYTPLRWRWEAKLWIDPNVKISGLDFEKLKSGFRFQQRDLRFLAWILMTKES